MFHKYINKNINNVHVHFFYLIENTFQNINVHVS